MNMEDLTMDQELKVTVKVLKQLKEMDGLSKDFHMYLDILINSLSIEF